MRKLMIVDDDKLTVSLLVMLLELDDFEVIAVPDGATALTKAKEIKPEAFVVDYHLAGGSSGIDFIKTVRAEAQFVKTPVVMASGLDRGNEAKAAGANHFMLKPFDPGDLVSVLNKLLAKNA